MLSVYRIEVVQSLQTSGNIHVIAKIFIQIEAITSRETLVLGKKYININIRSLIGLLFFYIIKAKSECKRLHQSR